MTPPALDPARAGKRRMSVTHAEIAALLAQAFSHFDQECEPSVRILGRLASLGAVVSPTPLYTLTARVWRSLGAVTPQEAEELDLGAGVTAGQLNRAAAAWLEWN